MNAEADWSRIPEMQASVRGIFTSAEGDVWVQTPAPRGDVVYDVLAPDGSYLGTTVPTRLNLLYWLSPVVRGDALWAVVTDDLDVPYVIRLKITPVDLLGRTRVDTGHRPGQLPVRNSFLNQ